MLLVSPAGDVLAGHMGGPFWARKDEGAWSVPKGVVESGEDHWTAARREFLEETGLALPPGTPVDLGTARQGSKILHLWRLDGEVDTGAFAPGRFTMEWPPRSGQRAEFPEIDRLGWLSPTEASRLLVKAQTVFLSRAGLSDTDRPLRRCDGYSDPYAADTGTD